MNNTQSKVPVFVGFRVFEVAFAGLRGIGRASRSTLKALQTARMMQALNGLSDSQLAEIGVERRDIPRYAAHLMSDMQSHEAG